MRTPLLGTIALGCLLGAPLISFASPTPFLRRPDVHGDRILFTSEGDLWLGSIQNRSAMRITSDEGVEGPGHFSPDGRSIALTAQYDGGTDVYVMDAEGGMPRRLTYDPTGALVLGWTPNGKEIFFRSRRGSATRRNRLWAVPASGGSARMLPIPYGEFASVHADGHRIAYVPVSAEWQHWKRYHGGEADDIWLADTSAHAFRRLTDDAGVDTEPVWVGDAIYFVSERDGHANLYRLDPATRAVTAATRYTDYDVRYPDTDGKRVVFEHGDGLAVFDPASGTSQELRFDMASDRIHTRERRVSALPNLFGVALGPTGKRLFVSSRGQILSAPAEKGDVRVAVAQPGSRCQYPAWSRDGRRVAFVSDKSGEEQVWVAPASGPGDARQVTQGHEGPLGPPVWSPDGKWIAVSDREMRIFLVDVEGGAMRMIDQADRGGSYDVVNDSYRFSPDSRWLAFARPEPNWNWSIMLYDVAGKAKTRVTSPEMNCIAPAFDADGTCLYFLADRAFDPHYVNVNRYFTYDKFTMVSAVVLAADGKSPFLVESEDEGSPADSAKGAKTKPAKGTAAKSKTASEPARARVDVAGIEDRVTEVPVPADHYVRVEPGDGRLFLETREQEADDPSSASRQLRVFDMKKKKVSVLVKTLTDFQLSADRKKLLLQNEKAFQVADAGAETIDADKGQVPTGDWIVTATPPTEWAQMFRETWRIARNFFYDPKMHGVDWNAVRRKYEAMLPAVADRSDLNFVLGEMVAELNCGHAYIGGGDLARARSIPMGFLGADVVPVAGPTPAYRVTRIYPGDGFDLGARSPLLEPGLGIKTGDYILAVAGRPVRADEDLQALLVGTPDRSTRITVNSRPSRSGARDVFLKPMASERWARYYDWVASREDYVRTHGGANLGYLHIPTMTAAGLREFAKHYYPNLGRDGLVVDVRYNGGGFIDAMLLLQLSSKPYSWFKPRYGESWTRQDWAFAGHSVALCNEESGSDAEEFCDAFQRLKLGPVVGVKTWGGEVGSGGGYTLLDGGSVFIPNYGEWVAGEGWVIEGRGVEPDVVVPEDPAALMAGKDPQLDRAITLLRDRLASDPLTRPVPPAFPNKALPGVEADPK